MGRPTVYSQEAADAVVSRMQEGEALRAICRDPDMPSEAAVRLWAREDREGFAARFARAWEMRAERLAEEIIEIADDGTGDTWVDDDGQVRTNNDVIQRSKLRVDARKWLLSKVLPGKYGDSSRLEVSGNGESPLVTRIILMKPDAADG